MVDTNESMNSPNSPPAEFDILVPGGGEGGKYLACTQTKKV
jgi:hypothetical protein